MQVRTQKTETHRMIESIHITDMQAQYVPSFRILLLRKIVLTTPLNVLL